MSIFIYQCVYSVVHRALHHNCSYTPISYCRVFVLAYNKKFCNFYTQCMTMDSKHSRGEGGFGPTWISRLSLCIHSFVFQRPIFISFISLFCLLIWFTEVACLQLSTGLQLLYHLSAKVSQPQPMAGLNAEWSNVWLTVGAEQQPHSMSGFLEWMYCHDFLKIPGILFPQGLISEKSWLLWRRIPS